jgi:NIPSNAP
MNILYELRIYTMHPGRMDAINTRFADHSLGIFRRMEMKVNDFWIDQEGHPKLYYLMEFKDREERERKWTAFREDSEWIEVKRKSEESGQIVANVEEIFMTRANYFERE